MKGNYQSSARVRMYGMFLLAAWTLLLSSRPLAAQAETTEDDSDTLSAVSPAASLPDAPEVLSRPQSSYSVDGERRSATAPATADRFAKYIQPGETALPLSGFDKVLLGARHATSSFAAATWVVSAGYEQILNSRPNYGETFKGYMQRLGAAAAHNVSEGVFSDSVLATVLHEDPRYYKLGPGHPLNERLVHALLQPLITRTDNGARTINFAQIGGNLAGAGLADAYYPPINRTTGATLITFGTSMGGGAIGYLFNEFFSVHWPVSR